MLNQRTAKKMLHWALAIVTVIMIIAGLSITYFRTFEYLTLGLLQKSLAFRIHSYVFILFLILFVLHIFIRPILKYMKN